MYRDYTFVTNQARVMSLRTQSFVDDCLFHTKDFNEFIKLSVVVSRLSLRAHLHGLQIADSKTALLHPSNAVDCNRTGVV